MPPLELVDQEVQIPGTARALDILARLPTGELIAIENQFGTADHDHLTRGLAYAVGLEASALIVVAEGHLGEFRAVARYLNTVAEKSESEPKVFIYLVTLSVEHVEEYVIPRLALIESPNTWIEAASASQPAGHPASLEEVLANMVPSVREQAEAIAEWWKAEVGTLRCRTPRAISLDCRHPSRPNRPLSCLLLYVSGKYTIQRGYLVDSGVIPADQISAFDSFLEATFPDLSWTGKHYFLDGTGPPELAAVKAFSNWLTTTPG
jgi:hypothetical protein